MSYVEVLWANPQEITSKSNRYRAFGIMLDTVFLPECIASQTTWAPFSESPFGAPSVPGGPQDSTADPRSGPFLEIPHGAVEFAGRVGKNAREFPPIQLRVKSLDGVSRGEFC